MVLITLTFLPFTAPFATFDWGAPLANSLCSGERQVSFANGRADESGAEVLAAAINSTVVAGENLTVGSTVWLPAASVAPGR